MSANARLDEFFEKAAKSRLPDNKRANVPVPKAPKIRRPTKILIYEALLSFLKSACSDRTLGLRAILDGYLLSMASDSVVNAIVGSLECRRKLLQLSADLGFANDPKLRSAVRADDERIATLLVSIFNSKSAEEAVLCLEGDSAQYFLDVVQDMLDKGFLLEQEHSRMAHRIIRKLSEACDRLPSSLFITGVSGREENPTFGGGYGDIYRASHGKKPVALKRMRHFLRGSDLRRIRLNICREALVWKDLHHQHILPFLGIDQDSFPSSLCMVSPWMEHGTVVTYLKDHGYANVDKLLYEISQGLQYLHSRNIVHGDLRGANILINEDWSACLADFGLSIFSDVTSSMSTNRGGSLYWMAPELLDPDRFGTKFIRTLATDVYAFGCVCLELYTGRPPFSNLSEPAAMMKVINGERPDRPSASPAMSDTLWQHVTEFWAQIPTMRPLTDLVVRNMVWPIPGVESSRPLSARVPGQDLLPQSKREPTSLVSLSSSQGTITTSTSTARPPPPAPASPSSPHIPASVVASGNAPLPPPPTLKCKRSREMESDSDDDEILLFASPVRSQATPDNTATAPKNKNKLGISHLPLLYDTRGNTIHCRSCALSFPVTAVLADLVGHSRGAHADACAGLEALSPAQVVMQSQWLLDLH